ncbi:MAG: hypothetical protein PW843_08505 [Azospirillaceae bacterium]|nr:hypothetical protein [Azospirillaceae bacterium]
MARTIVIERGPGGLWAAHDSAGLIGGIFTRRRDAVTFAAFQPGHPTVLLRGAERRPQPKPVQR